MIRFICKSYLSYPWMVRVKIFHPSLERLAELGEPSFCRNTPTDSVSEEFTRILHDLSIRGVWRWTERRRLRGLDRLLSDFALAQGWKEMRMLDIGASDGVTALDTLEHMGRETPIRVAITAVDRHVQLLSIRHRGATLYFTSTGRPTLLRLGRWALRLEPMEGIEGLLFNKAAALLERRMAAVLGKIRRSVPRTISLINPAVRGCPSIEVCERDLFDPQTAWFGKYDVVRASNVLNLSYYDQRKIREAIGVLHRYLREGGALLVSRNEIDGGAAKEMGGLWRKSGTGFTRVCGLQELPEVAPIVDGFRSPGQVRGIAV